jgi:AcrR family transcriptional regulator
MKPNQQPRLCKTDWLLAGLESLAKDGPGALKASKIARNLGVTTGSFYWHFACLADFRTKLPVYWREEIVGGLIRTANGRAKEPPQVLPEIRKLILASGAHRYDASMRAWARTDPLVREAVEAADEDRAKFLVETLCKTGMKQEDARDRAQLIGAAWRGSVDLIDPEYRMKLMGVAASD